MIAWWWIPVAIVADWYVGKRLVSWLYTKLGRKSKWPTDIIRRLDHDALVALNRLTDEEIARRAGLRPTVPLRE